MAYPRFEQTIRQMTLNFIRVKFTGILFAMFLLDFGASAQDWQSLGTPFQAHEGAYMFCSIIDPDTGDLIIGGGFVDDVDGEIYSRIARWDGTQYHPMGCGFTDFCGEIWDENASYGPRDLIYFQDTLYAAGYFESSGEQTLNHVAKWDGESWHPVGEGFDDPVSDLAIHQGSLFAGGIFMNSGENQCNGLARWNGEEWQAYNDFPLLNNAINWVNAIESYQGQLYVGGNLNLDPDLKELVTWTGSEWADVGSGFCGNLSSIVELTIFNEQLVVAGYFHEADCGENPGNFIASWDGTMWNDMNGGFVNPFFPAENNQVKSLWSTNEYLYAAGALGWIGNENTDRVARWDGEKWCSYQCENYPNSIIHPLQNVIEYEGNIIIGGPSNIILDNFDLGCVMWFEDEPDSCYAFTTDMVESPFFSAQANSTSHEIKISLLGINTAQVTIYNSAGAAIKQVRIRESDTTIKIDELAAGLYVLQILAENKVGSYSFVRL